MLYEVITSIIPSGGTDSDLVDFGNRAIAGLIIPAIDSAALTFKAAAHHDNTPVPVKDKLLALLTISAGTGACAIDADSLVGLTGFRWVQIIAGVAQSAARTFKWVVKG